MATSDDLVIKPRFGPSGAVPSIPTSPGLQRASRSLTTGGKRGSLIGRVVQGALIRRAVGGGLTRFAGVHAARFAGLGRLAGLGRFGAAGGLLALAGIVAAKLYSGRTFEQMELEAEEWLFGSSDDDARARRTVREQLMGDRHLSSVAAKNGSGELLPLFDAMVAQEQERERARGAVMRDKGFEVRSELDMLFDGVAQAVSELWQTRKADFEEFKAAIHRRSARSKMWGAR
jgi:hypothetical protein